MVVRLKNSFYICTVKFIERHEVAAEKQRFLCSQLYWKNKRKEWGTGNRPEVNCNCSMNLTAPTALSFINV